MLMRDKFDSSKLRSTVLAMMKMGNERTWWRRLRAGLEMVCYAALLVTLWLCPPALVWWVLLRPETFWQRLVVVALCAAWLLCCLGLMVQAVLKLRQESKGGEGKEEGS